MHKRKLLGFVVFLLLFTGSLGVFVQPVSAVTRTWDGGGTDGTCGGAGTASNWSCPANWSSDTAPTSSDLAVFDGTSSNNATINANINVAGIQMNSGYTGTITQASGITVTVGSSNFVVSAGTFTGGNANITVNGSFTVSGGTFTTTSATTQVRSCVVSSGTLTATSGAFVLSGGTNPSLDVNATQTFNDLSLDTAAGGVTIGTGDVLTVNGTLTLNHSVSSGTISAMGNIVQNATDNGGTTIVDFANNSVAQTWTINGGIGPVVRLDSASDASDSIVFAAAGTLNGLTMTSGFSGTIPISNGSDFAMTVGVWNQAAGTFSGSGFSHLTVTTLTVSGGTFTAPTTVSTTGTNPTFNVPNNQAFNNLTVAILAGSWNNGAANNISVTGTLTMTAAMNGGTVSLQANGVQNAGAGGGTTIVDFANDSTAQTWTINAATGPVLRLDSASDASDSIVFAATGGLNGLTIASGFSGTVPISNASDFTMTVNTWTQSAGTFSGSGFSNLTLTALTVSGGTFTAPTTITTAGVNPSFNVPNNQAFNNVTIAVAAGNWFNAAANTFITTGTLTIHALLNSGTISAQGNVTQNASAGGGTTIIDFASAGAQTYTLTGGTSPVIRLDSSDDASDTILFSAAATVGTLTVTSGFSGTIPISDPSNFAMTFNNFTQAAGTLDGSPFTNFNLGNLTLTGGTFTPPTTVNLTTGGSTLNVNSTLTFTNLTVNLAGSSIIVSNGDTVIVSGTLALTKGFNNTATGILEADGNCTIASTWSHNGGGILTFGGSATQTFDLTGATGQYNGDIVINKTGGQVNLASNLVENAVNQDLTIQSGRFNTNGHSLTVNGTNGTFVVQNTGTFVWQGAETLTLNAGQPTLQTGSTVEYTGNGNSGADTYTVTTLSATYSSLTINSTDGATDTFQLGANIDINGNFTNTAGNFDVTASNRQMNVAGNWTNTGTFTHRSGTVILDGTTQSVDDTTFFNFTDIDPDGTLSLAAGETQTFTGTLDLEGTSGHPLALRSSSTGDYAYIDPQGSRTIAYVDVKDSYNSNASVINCPVTCIDSGHNVNWNLPLPPPPPGTYSYTYTSIVLSRLKDPTPANADINYTAVNTLNAGTVVSITFPVGWSGFVAPTGGTGLGTSPTFGIFANGFTATCGTGGCVAGAITVTGGQATTPGTPGNYIIYITNNQNSDSSAAAVYVVDDDQVNISAKVDATLTFDIDTPAGGATCTSTGTPYTVGLGTITTSDVRTSGTTDGVQRICLNVATNAAHGVTITVKSGNASLKSSSTPADTIASATTTMAAGTANYGLCVVTAASGLSASSPFASTCAIDSNTNHVGLLDGSTQNLLTSAAPVTSGTSTVSVNAAINTLTRAHNDYADTLTFIATGSF